MKKKVFAFKSVGEAGKLGEGKPVTPEQLAIINQKYSNVPLKAEDIYVREMLLAHSAIDRDGERFHPEQLQVFSGTLQGKGFFAEGHPGGFMGSNGPGRGRMFATDLKEMTPQEFMQLTGEMPELPAGDNMVACLFATPYVLKLDSNSDTLKNIDAGIHHYVSIGFDAPFSMVTDASGKSYGEYKPTQSEKGEALEGSLVWLGAQPGASMQKGAKGADTHLNEMCVTHANSLIDAGKIDRESSWTISAEEENAILGDPQDWHAYAKWFLGMEPGMSEMTKERYKYPIGKDGKVYRSALTAIRQRAGQQKDTEIYDAAGKLINAIDEKKSHEPQGGKNMKEFLKGLGAKLGKTFTEGGAFNEIVALVGEKDAKINELSPLAEEGKAYRKSLVDDTVKFGVMIGEIKTDEETQKKEADFLQTLPIDRLKGMKDKYELKARKLFPAQFTVHSQDSEGRQHEKAGETAQANALLADAKKRAEAAQKK